MTEEQEQDPPDSRYLITVIDHGNGYNRENSPVKLAGADSLPGDGRRRFLERSAKR